VYVCVYVCVVKYIVDTVPVLVLEWECPYTYHSPHITMITTCYTKASFLNICPDCISPIDIVCGLKCRCLFHYVS